MNSTDYNNQAINFYNKGIYKDAEVYFKKAIEANPEHAEAYSNLGALYAKFKDYDNAIRLYQECIRIKPSYAGAYTNLGNALNKTYRYEEAVYFHKTAIHLDGKAANHYANCGSAYKNLGRFDIAQKMYEKAIELEPSHVNAHFDLSTVLLQTSQFKDGWKEYEWRFKKDEMLGHIKQYESIFSKPIYVNQDLMGKTILLHSEQGFGDSIMMIRYVYHLVNIGVNVVLYLREGLAELFKNIKGIYAIQTRGDKPKPFDYHLPIMSLASCFDKELIEVKKYYPYLKVEQKNYLKQTVKYKIGIVWDASATGESYDKKVFALDYFIPLSKTKDIQLYSLQLGNATSQLEKESFNSTIIDLSSKINNFADTASLIQELDLVISSDTSVAHLAGALGKEVWVLLQKVPDWRWGVSGEKSLWYPSARLFWQYSLGDWNSVFQQVYKALSVKLQDRYNQNIIYMPSVFDKPSIDEAKAIILTKEDSSTEDRWEKETPYIANKIINFIKIDASSIIVDFGCGIGRVSKALIEQTGCKVIGVDISETMRSQAVQYVDNNLFTVVSPDKLVEMMKDGLKVDGIVSIWVLQHIPKPDNQINLLYHLLKKEGKIFILNNLRSALPTNKGWIDEGTDIKKLLKNYFVLEFEDILPSTVSTEKIIKNSFLAGYSSKETV